MSDADKSSGIDDYKFHHIDTNKCKECKSYSCEDVCFRGIYHVINKETEPKSVVIEEREDRCVKCHMCTTACKAEAITID